MKTAEAPFPFTSMFQNGPRRQGSAAQNLFKPRKDFPPPRTNRAPLPAPGRSEDFPMRRERGQMQSQSHSPFVADYVLPLVGIVEAKSLLTRPQNPKIRAPPVDDVNNLRHDCKCQRRFASTAIQIRRNALFTSPEYALHDKHCGRRPQSVLRRWGDSTSDCSGPGRVARYRRQADFHSHPASRGITYSRRCSLDFQLHTAPGRLWAR
jgi:hypothetical protein